MSDFLIRPKELGLYLTRQCNLSCPTCLFRLQQENFHSFQQLTYEQAISIIDFYRLRGIERIFLQSEGEIILYNDYWRILDYCRNVGHPVRHCITNGILIDKYLPDILKNFQTISISIDGFDSNSYGARRGGKSETFRKICSNIKLLSDKSHNDNIACKIHINCVLTASNFQIIPKMIKLAESLNVYSLKFRNYHRYQKNDREAPLYKTQSILNFLKVYQGYKSNVKIKWPELYNSIGKFNCKMLFDTVTIGSDGNFATCCHIPSNNENGSFFDSPFLFNSEPILSFRRQFHQANAIKQLPFQCQECPRLHS